MKEKKGLFIAGNVYRGCAGDSIFTIGLIERIQKKMKLDLLTTSFYEVYNDKNENCLKEYYERNLKKKFGRTWIIDFDPKKTGFYFSLNYSIFLFPMFYSKDMEKKLPGILMENDYDYIFIDHIRMFYLFEIIKKSRYNSKVILIEHNIEYEVYNDYLKYNKQLGFFMKLASEIVYAGFGKYEIKCWRKVDNIITLSEKDKSSIVKQINDESKINVAMPYFNFERVKDDDNIRKPSYNLLYLGSMWWYPNEVSVIWLIEKVFIPLRKIDNRYKLFVVGIGPSPRIMQYNSDKIIITGKVKTVDTYINDSDFLIIPTFMGGGVKVKIMEGIKKGIPILANSMSLTGYPGDIFKNNFLVDTPDEFINSIIYLNDHPQEKIEFIENANKIIENTAHKIDVLFRD